MKKIKGLILVAVIAVGAVINFSNVNAIGNDGKNILSDATPERTYFNPLILTGDPCDNGGTTVCYGN